jgi:uncharacterized membrane protein
MYLIREFAACLIVATIIVMVLFIICGIGYLLKLGFTISVWMVRKIVIAYRESILKPQAIGIGSISIVSSIATPAVVADFPS